MTKPLTAIAKIKISFDEEQTRKFGWEHEGKSLLSYSKKQDKNKIKMKDVIEDDGKEDTVNKMEIMNNKSAK